MKDTIKVIEYSEYNESMGLECNKCGWKGTPLDTDGLDCSSQYSMDITCPKCTEIVLASSYPKNKIMDDGFKDISGCNGDNKSNSSIDVGQCKKDWEKRFSEASDEELKKIFEDDRKKSGWVSVRGIFHSLLEDEFKKRGLSTKR